MENQEKVRKIRSKPMRWLRFFRVKNGEKVFHGKQSFRKLSFCTAFKHGETVGEQSFVLMNPFRRVKTTQPVKEVTISESPIEYSVWETRGGTTPEQNEARFPFSGGHHPVPTGVTGRLNTRENIQSMDCPRGDEPNNANNITGPTS